jgi:hypothetical protein
VPAGWVAAAILLMRSEPITSSLFFAYILLPMRKRALGKQVRGVDGMAGVPWRRGKTAGGPLPGVTVDGPDSMGPQP